MYEANLYDRKTGSFKLTPFKSLTLLLARAKADDKLLVKVYNGKEEMMCKYDPRQGWIIGKPTLRSSV